jgi:hypothetical protein
MMKAHRFPLAVVLILGFLPTFALAQESEDYLGNKLEYVLTNVDNDYLRSKRQEFAERHKKALRKLGEFLIKQHPDMNFDVNAWLESHYAEDLRELQAADPEQPVHTADILIALDRQHEEFRSRFLSFLKTRYPGLFGEVAGYLRDNQLGLLREVLRMTLRMTSNVEPVTTIVMHPVPGEESPEVSEATSETE